MIYLDHNATTPVAPQVREAMAPYFGVLFGNPSSGYGPGILAKEGLEKARAQVAGLLGAGAGEVVFTSGGTESNNWALYGAARALDGKGKKIITSSVEHPAITNPALELMHQGYEVDFIGVDRQGRVKLDELEEKAAKGALLISVMHANNETGVVQPLAEISGIAKKAGALFHTDAAQSVGKIPSKVDELGVDFLSVAGHKLYAPKGIGALYIREGSPLASLMQGGGQEGNRRPGTENVAFAAGLGAACVLAMEEMETQSRDLEEKRDLLHGLLARKIPGLALNGHKTKRLPNTLNVSFPGVSGQTLLENTPEICASTGAACHGGKEKVSHVLAAMGLAHERGMGAVRLTLGRGTSRREVEKAACLLAETWKRLS